MSVLNFQVSDLTVKEEQMKWIGYGKVLWGLRSINNRGGSGTRFVGYDEIWTVDRGKREV